MSLSLVITDKNIESKIKTEISKEINKRSNKNKNRVIKELKNLVSGWIQSSPEIQSIASQGAPESLNAVFGLSPFTTDAAVAGIVKAVSDSIEVSFKKIDKNLNGDLIFNFQSQTFANLLGLPQGHQETEFGGDLHWLDWLLTKGDSIIVQGFYYVPSNGGRSGGGTMKIGGSFRVPAQFSGTPDENFITRAFQGREKQLSATISKLLG